jgi:hypothetical protein
MNKFDEMLGGREDQVGGCDQERGAISHKKAIVSIQDTTCSKTKTCILPLVSTGLTGLVFLLTSTTPVAIRTKDAGDGNFATGVRLSSRVSGGGRMVSILDMDPLDVCRKRPVQLRLGAMLEPLPKPDTQP